MPTWLGKIFDAAFSVAIWGPVLLAFVLFVLAITRK